MRRLGDAVRMIVRRGSLGLGTKGIEARTGRGGARRGAGR
ncbi:Hypothetical protein A7982_02666 [Minicystis rosea]|nr:Hypothetical protein A7982_02666 [Minicystis rosea]